jgi:hypothetical protein
MQFSRRSSTHDCLDEAYVPFFGAFGTARDDAIIARWSANPLAMLWPEMNAAFVSSGGGMGPGRSAASGGHHCRRYRAEAIHRADRCGGIRNWCSALS